MRIRSIHTERLVERADAVERLAGTAPAEALSEFEAARYIGMSAGWLKKSRTKRFRDRSDAPPFVRAGARRIVYRRKDLEAWLAAKVERVGTSGRPTDYGLPRAASTEATGAEGLSRCLQTQR